MLADPRFLIIVLFVFSVTSCSDLPTTRTGIARVHEGWRAQNQTFLAEQGSREVNVDQDIAFAAAQASLRRIGLGIDEVDPSGGVVMASRFLNAEDIGPEVREAEIAFVRQIMTETIGERGQDVELTFGEGSRVRATVNVTNGATPSQVTIRMCNVTQRRDGSYFEGDCIIPTSRMKAGINEFWRAFDGELAARMPAQARTAPAPRVAQPSGTQRGTSAQISPRVDTISVEPTGPIVEPSGWVLPD